MRTISKLGAMLGAGLLLFAFVGATSLVSANGVKVTLCHATPPDTAANGWHTVNTSTNSDGSLKGGHDTSHDKDIIPAYDDGSFHYPGKNLTTDFGTSGIGADILANDCASALGTGGPPPPVVTGEPATDTAFGSTGSSGPSDTAWLLVVGLGVLLASIVVLTPARAKSRR